MLENIPWGLIAMQGACMGCFGLGYWVKSKGVTGIISTVQTDIAKIKTEIENVKAKLPAPAAATPVA